MSERLRVETLAAGGDGLARRADGAAVFIHGGLPGDLWSGTFEPLGRRAFRLVEAERLEDGPQRMPARCPSRPQCGGCNWHELERAASMRAKGGILRDALTRIAGLEAPLAIEQLTPSEPYDGRYRVGLRVTPSGLAYSGHASHDSVVWSRCEALTPHLEVVMKDVSQKLASLPPGLVSVQASLSADGRKSAARLTVIDKLTRPAIRHLCQAVVAETALDGAWVGVDHEVIEAGQTRLSGLISSGVSRRYLVRGGAFHQANPTINKAIVRAVVEAAEAGRRTRVVDMHGGAGNFGLALAAKGADVTISETDPWVFADLEVNAASYRGRGVVHAAEMSGAQALKRCSRRGRVDVAVFDAPRTGDPSGAKAVAEIRPKRVVALGCDPSTFARDLQAMGLGRGYRLERLGLWDAFPQTHHFESLAVLECVS